MNLPNMFHNGFVAESVINRSGHELSFNNPEMNLMKNKFGRARQRSVEPEDKL